MRGIEKFIVLWAMGYMAIYIPFFVFIAPQMTPAQFWEIIPTFHWIGLTQNLLAMIITIRDLYKRDFPNPNQKLTWGLLITWTGIGWFVYLFRYAFKPRTFSVADGSIT